LLPARLYKDHQSVGVTATNRYQGIEADAAENSHLKAISVFLCAKRDCRDLPLNLRDPTNRRW